MDIYSPNSIISLERTGSRSINRSISFNSPSKSDVGRIETTKPCTLLPANGITTLIPTSISPSKIAGILYSNGRFTCFTGTSTITCANMISPRFRGILTPIYIIRIVYHLFQKIENDLFTLKIYFKK